MKRKVGKAGVASAIALVLAAGAAGIAIASNVRASNLETTKELTASAFSIGMLDDDTGKLPSEDVDKGGLYTSKYYEFDGMDFEFVKEATVELQVNYYDADKTYLGAQTWTTDYNAAQVVSTATSAKYVKFEIIPTEDDDDTVDWTEKTGYVNQLTITVAK